MLHRLLPPHPKEAPRKKFRGKRRYFRRVFRVAEGFVLDVSEVAWYRHWHLHLDWRGYGNLSWRLRATHLRALAKVYLRFAEQLQQSQQPYQLWIYLDARDAGQDAVFVHTPNPSDQFPLTFEGTEQGVEAVSAYFEGLLPGIRLRAGRWREDTYYIYSPEIGVSLEGAAGPLTER